MHRGKIRVLILGAAIIGLAACSSTQEPNLALEQARETYSRINSEPDVARHAALELQEAREALERSEALWREDADEVDVTHAAYLASQRAKIAEQTARTKTAQEALKEAEAARDAAALRQDAREAEVRALALEQEKREAQEQASSAQSQISDLQAQLEQAQSKGVVLTLGNDILFDIGESTLKAGASAPIQNVADFLQENPERQVNIIGYTDSSGSDELNQRLSEARAGAVREMLMELGVTSAQVTSEGRGEHSPIASNDTTAGRQLNRRVELAISDPDTDTPPAPEE